MVQLQQQANHKQGVEARVFMAHIGKTVSTRPLTRATCAHVGMPRRERGGGMEAGRGRDGKEGRAVGHEVLRGRPGGGVEGGWTTISVSALVCRFSLPAATDARGARRKAVVPAAANVPTPFVPFVSA